MAIVESIDSPAGARRRLRVSSPVTGEAVGEIDVQTAEDVRAALEIARKSQPAWAALSFEQRARYVTRALHVLLDRYEEFIDVVVRETGKTRLEALAMEIFASCDCLQYYAKRSAKILSARPQRMHLLGLMKKLRIVYRPLGVVGIITPWNGPFVLSLNPTVQALMAGNAVLLKPSEVTPYSGRLVADLFEAAGLPEGLLHVLLGDGETGQALTESEVDKISFTGSVETGRPQGGVANTPATTRHPLGWHRCQRPESASPSPSQGMDLGASSRYPRPAFRPARRPKKVASPMQVPLE